MRVMLKYKGRRGGFSDKRDKKIKVRRKLPKKIEEKEEKEARKMVNINMKTFASTLQLRSLS